MNSLFLLALLFASTINASLRAATVRSEAISPFEEQIWVEGEISFPAPPYTEYYPQAFPLGPDILFHTIWTVHNSALSSDLSRLSAAGTPLWTKTNILDVFLYLPRPDGKVWLVSERTPERYTIAIVDRDGEVLKELTYEGSVSQLKPGHQGETLLIGTPLRIVNDSAAVVSERPGTFRNIVTATDGRYLEWDLVRGGGTSYIGSAFRFLDSQFERQSEWVFPLNIWSAVVLTDGKIAAVVQDRSSGKYRITLIDTQGKVVWEQPAFAYNWGPKLAAGDAGDFWVLRNTVAGAVPGGANARLSHFSGDGALLGEIPLDTWDPETANFSPDLSRPGWLRLTALTRPLNPSQQATRKVVGLSFTAHRVPAGTPRISVNGLHQLQYELTNAVDYEVQVSSSQPDLPLYFTLDGSTNIATAHPYEGSILLGISSKLRALARDKSGITLASEPISVSQIRTPELRTAVSRSGELVLQYFTTEKVPEFQVSLDLLTWQNFSMPLPTNGLSQRQLTSGHPFQFFRHTPP